jgi:DNA-binding transcriptional MerR regulator
VVLAIGEFSRMTHLSVRTLRRYHDAGLLEPATVDLDSGYRYYSADQIPTAQVIHRLRELDVPLPDVQRILRSPDPDSRAALVSDHLGRLESELDRTRAAVREAYLVGPRDTADPAAWRTEIGWPVFRVVPG